MAQNAPEQRTMQNCEQYRSLVETYKDWDSNIMLAIMRGESGCNPNAINGQDNHRTCVGSYSLLQVGCLHYADGQDKLDPATNIEVAHSVYQSQGLNAWTVYSSGKYLSYL